MSVVHSLSKNEIAVNDEDSIIVEGKSEDGYFWNEVTFKSGEEKFYIGSYYTYNYSSSHEWMEYNSDFIVLMVIYTYEYEVSEAQVNKLFDIKSKQFMNGTQDELIESYNNSFKGVCKKKIK